VYLSDDDEWDITDYQFGDVHAIRCTTSSTLHSDDYIQVTVNKSNYLQNLGLEAGPKPTGFEQKSVAF